MALVNWVYGANWTDRKVDTGFYLIKNGLETSNGSTGYLLKNSIDAQGAVTKSISYSTNKILLQAYTPGGVVSEVRGVFQSSAIDLTKYKKLIIEVNEFQLGQYSSYGRNIYLDITSNLPADNTLRTPTNPTIILRSRISEAGILEIDITDINSSCFILPDLWIHYGAPAQDYVTKLGIKNLYLE